MHDEPHRRGLATVPLPGALAVFAGANRAPAGLDAAALATAAGDALSGLIGCAVPVLYARQEHTALTYSFSSPDGLPPGAHLVGRCDGLITAEERVGLLVRTADCLPVALAGGGTVAMVHAGWRGLAADILGATVRRIGAEYGVPPGRLAAVIGVGIGPCHYQVGEEVVEALGVHPVAACQWHGNGTVDLAAWAGARLRTLGLAQEDVEVLPGCTACSRDLHSFRRDGAVAGRQWSAVVLSRA